MLSLLATVGYHELQSFHESKIYTTSFDGHKKQPAEPPEEEALKTP